jgi:ZIP family zinc transporter
MPDETMNVASAFGWGMAASSGVLIGAIVGLVTDFRHRTIAAIMSVGAGVLLSVASIQVASEALALAGAVAAGSGIFAGAISFSMANAALASARDRKRCGDCKAQPTEANDPGSGTAIALGSALDALPEALILGITLQVGGPNVALVAALGLSNLPEGLSGTSGMRSAGRSSAYVLSLWSGIALGTAAITALAFNRLGNLGPNLTAVVMAYGAGALIAMAAETMIPEAFHNSPRYSGALAAAGFAALMFLIQVAR